MAFSDAFSLFGHFAFSSKPTHGRAIYESILDGQGDAYNKDFNGLQQARNYALSICLATAQYEIDRAGNNRNPAKATELLGKLEEDFQVTPSPTATLPQRRAFLSALVKITHGNSQSAISGALALVLGSDFVSYTQLGASTWPPSPGDVGVFDAPSAKVKQFTIVEPVSITGTPISLTYTKNIESDAPLPGEKYCVDPDPRRGTEQITLISVSGGKIRASFSRSHEPGTLATRPYPLWTSQKRINIVTVTPFAASDPESRRLVNEIMGRALRATSTWSIITNAGVFTPDVPGLDLPDSVPLG